MKRKIFITTALACGFMVCLAAIADLNGKWTGRLKGPDGSEVQVTYVFKIDGDKLTGTGESDGSEMSVDSGKVSGNDIKFSVTSPEGIVIPHHGKYFSEGDSISMDINYQGAKLHTTLKHPEN
jgi:hypothetical protein